MNKQLIKIIYWCFVGLFALVWIASPVGSTAKAESLRLAVPGDTMTVESDGRPLARLIGTRVGTQPKIELITTSSSHNRKRR